MTLAARAASVESASFVHYLNTVDAENMRKAGVTFNTLSQSDLATLKKAAMELLDEKAKVDAGSAKATQILKEAMKVYAP